MTTFAGGMTPSEYYARLNSLDSNVICNVKSYGALGDNNADDTIAIQTAINAAFTCGGGIVYFPVGIYIIGGALQTNIGGINYKSQLYIPDANANITTRAKVLLKGEISPNFFQTVGIGASVALYQTTSGVILKSTLLSSTADSYVIASKGAVGNAVANMNYNECDIEDIQIHVRANGSNQVTIGGVGFNNAADAVVKNVTAFPYNINLNDSATPINNCIGIAMPAMNCEHMSIVENCNVGGMVIGFLTGEHTSLKDTVANTCYWGYAIGSNYHHMHAVRIASYWCAYDIVFTGTAYVKIQGLQTEWINAGKWYDNINIVADASNYGHGEIYYHIVATGVGFDNSKFSKDGGSHLNCYPICFANGSSFTVSGARDEPEGALKDLIAKLVAKGIIIDGTTAS